MDADSEEDTGAPQPEVKDNPLPEGFFDDPVMDAKVSDKNFVYNRHWK